MLEFGKLILEKVSFSAILFEKELNKIMKWMTKAEMQEFEKWCKNRFASLYPDIIFKSFKNV